MKKMKKIVSLLLTVALSFGLVACSTTGEKETGTDDKTTMENSEKSNGGTNNVASDSNANEESKTYTHMDLSIGFWGAGKIDTKNNDDLALKHIEEKFNVTITGKGVSWSDYKEKFKLWAAAGELPDVFGTSELMTETYFSWINQGIVRDWPMDLTDYPNLSAVLAQEDILPLKVDGKYYTFPRTNSEIGIPKLTERGLVIRKDWLEEKGQEIPTSYDEFTKVVKQLVETDMDGNGTDDTVGVTATDNWAFEAFFMDIEPTLVGNSWIEEDGKYVPYYMTEDAVKAVVRMKEMFETGVLDQDFAILQSGDGMQKFGQGNTAAIAIKVTPVHLKNLKNAWEMYDHDKSFEESVAIVPLWADKNGVYNGFNDTSYWSETYLNGDISDEKMLRILDIMEYLMTDEFKVIAKYGIEDIDFVKKGDEYFIADEEVNLRKKYPSIYVFQRLSSWNYNNELERSAYNDVMFGDDIMRLVMDSYEEKAAVVVPAVIDFEVRMMDIPSKNKLSTINFLDDLTKVVVSGNDVNEEWDKVLQSYKAQGVDDAIKEVNDRVQ